MSDPKRVTLPTDDLSGLDVGDRVVFSGRIYAGRDAVLPMVCSLVKSGRLTELDADFAGAGVFHTAVSIAGIGPTSSNKLEIEESFGPLCEAGIKVFLGKGAISAETVRLLDQYGAVFVAVPPVTALLSAGMRSKRCVAFPELGMEALYELDLAKCPGVVAAAHGTSVF